MSNIPYFHFLFLHIQTLYLYAFPKPHTYQFRISCLYHLSTVYTVCIVLSISGFLTPCSFKSFIKSKWFNLLFPITELYHWFILCNTSFNYKRDTTNSNGDNELPQKIPRFKFIVPRSALLEMKFVFQFFIVYFWRFEIFLADITSSIDSIIYKFCTMS